MAPLSVDYLTLDNFLGAAHNTVHGLEHSPLQSIVGSCQDWEPSVRDGDASLMASFTEVSRARMEKSKLL